MQSITLDPLTHPQVIDINDNAPEFILKSYDVVISEDMALYSEVLTVNAIDRDIHDVVVLVSVIYVII